MWKRKSGHGAAVTTLIGAETVIEGDVRFQGGLHVDGTIRGNVLAEEGADAVLILSEKGCIEGEVHVPRVILNGRVVGDVHAADQVELASRARVEGDVHYRLIEMAMGAEVNGRLVHMAEEAAGGRVVPLKDEAGDGGASAS
ncbi:MAG TPA: polymer-forming cytoskeletal family protein [Thiotrichales bacterium]|nr:polymer-forming cytoskeletal family protein [Thiotrichales bacterium]